MRLFPIWVVRPLLLGFVILSCATQDALGPTLKTVDGKPMLTEAASIGPKVVISQVYGGGGNAGATYNRDYVELFNAGDAEQPLTGWSLQYASATGTGNLGSTATQITPLSGSIAPGEYVLVEGAGGSTGATLTGDITDASPINLSGSAGKVVIANTGSSLGCNGGSTLCNAAALAQIVDLVGYGNANFFEGASAAPTLSNTTAGFRKDAGCTDTGINGSDFTSALPSPRTRATTTNPCVPVVPAGPVVSVTISPEDGTVRKGNTLQLAAVGKDVDGKNSSTTFTWLSSNDDIATVSATGLATGVNEGTVEVTATSANGVSKITTLSVAQPGQPASVSVAINDPRQAPVGYTKPAFPTVRDTDDAIITSTTTLVWSSSNPGVATVDERGYITGVTPGTVTIRATAPNGVFGFRTFTVIPATAPTSARYGNHLEFGAPSPGGTENDIRLVKPEFVASHNVARGGPNWVSWNLNGSQFGDAPRCDCFSADQSLPSNVYIVVDFDYRNGGYDRGHMVQSESRTATDQENAATFLLTNILPQAGANNQGPWLKFENYLNDHARARNGITTLHEVYVIAGGIYSTTPSTLKNEGKVAIPDYTWKVAVIMPEGQGLDDVRSVADLKVKAVRMPNLTSAGGPASAVGIDTAWAAHEVTVDELEAQTGYDFLSALPNRIELLVESGDKPPVAVIEAPSTGVEGSSLSFDGSGSSDPDGDALNYAWDFGDGSTGSGAQPNHTYADNGSYTVTLTVTDPIGADDSQSRVVTVSNATPVVKTLTATPTALSGETVFALATFGDAGADDDPWTYEFDWGAGTSGGSTSSQSASVGSSRSFFSAGTYSVGFTVTDKDLATSVRKVATFRVLSIPTTLSVNPERININGQGNGQVIVTVFGTATIDAAAIRLESVRIGTVGIDTKGNDGFKASVGDVNKDGIADRIVHFERGALVSAGQLTNRTTELVLHATLSDGRQIEARGGVRVGSKD